MCGFVGLYLNSGEDAPFEMEKIITNMTDKLEHRGPDGSQALYSSWSQETCYC